MNRVPPRRRAELFIERYRAAHQPGRILYVLLPCPASPSTIFEELLDKLGDPFPGRGTVANPCALPACRRCRWRQQQGVVYTAMTTQAGDVVAQYYAAFDSHRDGWQDLVTDDVLFDGPVRHARGKAEFVTLTGQFLQAHCETHLLGRVEDGIRVASLLEFASMRQTGSGWRALSPSGPRW